MSGIVSLGGGRPGTALGSAVLPGIVLGIVLESVVGPVVEVDPDAEVVHTTVYSLFP